MSSTANAHSVLASIVSGWNQRIIMCMGPVHERFGNDIQYWMDKFKRWIVQLDAARDRFDHSVSKGSLLAIQTSAFKISKKNRFVHRLTYGFLFVNKAVMIVLIV
jgi:hypothetical protein